jgi:hypothetical protein
MAPSCNPGGKDGEANAAIADAALFGCIRPYVPSHKENGQCKRQQSAERGIMHDVPFVKDSGTCICKNQR